jgi:hypothetical protein
MWRDLLRPVANITESRILLYFIPTKQEKKYMQCLPISMRYMVFFSPSRQMLEYYLKLGHNRSFQNPSQFITHQSFHPSY